MPKAHIRDGELRIPLTDDLREKLDVHDGDELEAHVFPGSVVLRTTSPEAREHAWDRLFSIIDRVHVRPGQPAMSIEEVEQMIVDEVHAFRRAKQQPAHD